MAVSTDKEFKKVPRVYGPQTDIAYVDFTRAGGGTTAPTVNDGQGVTSVVQSGAGIYVITLNHTAKAYNVTLGLRTSTVAAIPAVVVSAKSTSARTVTIQTSVAASGVVGDIAGWSLDVQIFLRTV